jgi:hypothetical protein
MKEKWREVVGFEGKYKVSDEGNIWSCYQKKKMRLTKHLGYYSVLLQKEGRFFRKRTSRLVYEAFVGPIPIGLQIDHIDRNRENNSIANLRCVNGFENQFNRIARRTIKKGNRWGYATRINGKLHLKSGFKTESEAHAACEKMRSSISR